MKLWWQSKAIWGGTISAIFGLAAMFGFAVSDAQQAQTVDSLMLLANALAAIVGGVLAIYGRIKATQQIKPSKTIQAAS
jgi:NAD/NADP transhydrogenase alpha subunit